MEIVNGVLEVGIMWLGWCLVALLCVSNFAMLWVVRGYRIAHKELLHIHTDLVETIRRDFRLHIKTEKDVPTDKT